MAVVAGLDIGNATTEAVLAEIDGGRMAVLGADRLPTRGPKGSPGSLEVGARLIRRLERAYGVRVDELTAAPLRPVSTETLTRPEPTVHTGRLRLVRAGAETAGGRGFGVGAPYLLGSEPAGSGPMPVGPVVAVVPAGLGYRAALPLLEKLSETIELAAVVVERDEAVLLANRLPAGLPIVDEVAPGDVLGAALVAVEARATGQPLTALADPLRLTAALGLADGERADAARLAARLYDGANAVVALDVTARPPEPEPAFELPDADDLFSVDLGALADRQLARVGSVASRTVVLAALRRDAPPVDPSAALAQRLGVPCRVASSEAQAALHGGRSTPGAPDDAVVVDLGGGTIDVVGPGFERTVAGAGELLTAATAGVLGSGRTTAEFAKRGPAFRVDGPQVLVAEDGARTFLDAPVPADVLGALVVDGPAGWLAVHRGLAPAEWRALRLRLKAEVLGENLARALGGQRPDSVVVIGGPAGDDEAIGCVARVLPPGTAVGRGNVAGRLGHRYGVAYGLLVASFSVGR